MNKNYFFLIVLLIIIVAAVGLWFSQRGQESNQNANPNANQATNTANKNLNTNSSANQNANAAVNTSKDGGTLLDVTGLENISVDDDLTKTDTLEEELDLPDLDFDVNF